MAIRGPDFRPPTEHNPTGGANPAEPAEQDSSEQPSASSLSILQTPLHLGARRRRIPRAWVRAGIILLTLALVMLAVDGVNHLRRSSKISPPAPTHTSPPPPVPMAWQHTANDLQTSHEGEILVSPDGGNSAGFVIDGGQLPVVLVKNASNLPTPDGVDTLLVAINPTTGRVAWKQYLARGSMCATTLLNGNLVCVEPLVADRATGLGTRWAVEERRPDTGTDIRDVEIDGWFCAVHISGQHIVLLEQQLPAPHAAIRALTPTLQQAWRVDLRTARNQVSLFSADHSWTGTDHYPAGLELRAPSIRDLAPGVLALSAGTATVFLDPASGRQLGFPQCSDPQVAGGNIWCNDGDHAVARVITGVVGTSGASGDRHLVVKGQAPPGVKVSHQLDMGATTTGRALTPTVFLEADDNVVGIDPVTGRASGRSLAIYPAGFARDETDPFFWQVGDLTLAGTGNGGNDTYRATTAFDAKSLSVRWRSAGNPALSGVASWRGRILADDGQYLAALNPRTGAAVEHFTTTGWSLVPWHDATLIVGASVIGQLAP